MMAIDFSKLVLRPAMAIFARPGVQYTPPGGSAVTGLRGVFDRQHEIVKTTGSGAEITTTAPVLGIRLSEWVPAPIQGGVVIVDGVNFSIFDVQIDGEGGADLIMREVVT